MTDVIGEIRKIRDDYAKKFGYDMDAMFRDLKQLERSCGRTLVSFPPRQAVFVPRDEVTDEPKVDAELVVA